MKPTIFIGLFMATAVLCSAQDDPIPIGYSLKVTQTVIKVYQDNNGQPVIGTWEEWHYSYWFKVDETLAGKAIVDGVDYMRITIPSGSDNKAKLTTPTPWTTAGAFINTEDFDSWLWIRKADFDAYKKNHYRRVARQLIFSGFTAPYKYRPKLNSEASSLLSGDVNLGTFLGGRVAFADRGGISLGGYLGLTSLTQNASNNTKITGTNSESINGFNYGFGLVFDWQKKFQLGVVVGFDHGVGNLSKTYLYQGERWFALSFNYKFLNFANSKDTPTQPTITAKK